MLQYKKIFCLLIFAVLTNENFSSAQSITEADALLQSVGKNSATTTGNTKQGINKLQVQIQLDDPFQRALYAEWQTHSGLQYHVELWLQKILSKDYRAAAHLWSRVEKDLPENFRITGETAYLYLLWKLNLAQTFWNEWHQLLVIDSKRKSPLMKAFLLSLEPNFTPWFTEAVVFFTPEQTKFIKEKLSNEQFSSIYDTLIALALLRSGAGYGQLSAKILERLPNTHPTKIPLAQTLALGYARSGDLANAGQVLKSHLEPAIIESKNKIKSAQYYLQVARLLYQANALDAAETFYRKIPNSIGEYLTAHEELTWILLRKNDVSQLRGELKNFQLGLFEQKFFPEIHVVSAIANLKLCYYSKVQDDFAKFLATQKIWAEKIREETKKEWPSAPPVRDYFITMAEKSLQNRERENKELLDLSQESITAIVPAVGIQHHWQRATQKQAVALNIAQKQVAREYLRQWKNMEASLREAIRKMKFVKVELLSQVSQLASTSRDGKLSDKNTKVALKINNDELAFPFDGVVWGDELFRLRSKAEGTCL